MGRLGPLSVNLLLALTYTVFVVSAVQFWVRTGSLVSIGLVTFNTLTVICVITRRRPLEVTGSIQNWILAPATMALPFLMRPVESAPSWPLVALSSTGQIAGLGIMVASLIALNRSIGIVAANRGVKTHGPYGWVRHPLYAGELLFIASFLLSHLSPLNGAIVCAVLLGQICRAIQEEVILRHDERYMRYQKAVAYRLIPGVF